MDLKFYFNNYAAKLAGN